MRPREGAARGPGRARALLALPVLGALACGGAPSAGRDAGERAPLSLSAGVSGIGRFSVKDLSDKPRLAIVSRDGDPSPALVVAVATDLDALSATALAALVEARLEAAGRAVTTHPTQRAFQVRLEGPEPEDLPAFFAALSRAFAEPYRADSKAAARIGARLAALRKLPLDAPALGPIAACTGELAAPPNARTVDPTSAEGAALIERWRAASLVAARTSVGAVGPEPFGLAATSALEASPPFPKGEPAEDPWPSGDSTGAYGSALVEPRGARLSLALRAGDPYAAVGAAEAFATPGSPLAARLGALAQPFRVARVVGVARPRGGCLAVELETRDQPAAVGVERSAALAASVARDEMRRALEAPASPWNAMRQILSAESADDAASRAAWWALAGEAKGAKPKVSVALGVSAGEHGPAGVEALGPKFEAELERVLAAPPAKAQRRLSVERGQGELWVLVASPCGVASENAREAGSTALALLAAVESERRRTDVSLEPWVTPDGAGVIAHASPRSSAESRAALAERVGGAAARLLAAPSLSSEELGTARASLLEHLERLHGPHGAAYEELLGGLGAESPSRFEPLGSFARVANVGLEEARLRAQAVASGPLRVAVIANADAEQAELAARAVDRWLPPRLGEPSCAPSSPPSPRPGKRDVKLPSSASVAQGLVGAPLPAGSPPELGELVAAALADEAGPLASLGAGLEDARARVRLLGGPRAAALVVDVRAPGDALGPALEVVKTRLAGLGASATEQELARALGRRERREAARRASPRHRVVDLWLGASAAPAAPSLAAWREFLNAAFREANLVVVEAKPETR